MGAAGFAPHKHHGRTRALLALALTWFVSMAPICQAARGAVEQTAGVDQFAYRTPGSSRDHRFSYELELLRLALDKTEKDFGPYSLKPAKSMNLPRTMMTASRSEQALIFKTSYSKELTQEFNYVSYPIDRGVFSHRICFVNSQIKDKVTAAKSIDELKHFVIGQGVGWLDVDILKHNGFTVRESPGYEQLFPMLAAGRLQLVCRAQSEIAVEWESFGHLGGFSVDQSFALYYPLPRFFWIHKSKQRAYDRLQQGLALAYQDGSALALWRKHYRQSLDHTPLKGRKVHVLSNPFLDGIDSDYKRYFLNQDTKPND